MRSVEEKIFTTINLSAGGTSETFDALLFSIGAFSAVWAAASHGDGTVTLQWSLDGTNWTPQEAATTITAGAGSKFWGITTLGRYYRFVIAKGSNVAGTIALRGIGKA